ncbi:MAG: CPBP family intramembrane metalloprotease [Phycisphaerae bacterium]|jgi:membrane protease YdiL (CAAX protease family)|nr:CPBP family intramembrane metalloprotease [Phycisphaerae bacterium]
MLPRVHHLWQRRKRGVDIFKLSKEIPTLPMPLWVAILLFFGSLLLGSLGALFGMSQGEPETIERLSWISGGAICAQIPVVIVYSLFVKPPNIRNNIGVILIIFVTFTPLALVTSGLAHALFSSIGWEDSNEVGHETLVFLHNAEFSIYLVVVVLAATLGAGVIEEIVFRGLLLPSVPEFVGSTSVWGAILITSAIFSAMHLGSVPLSALLGLMVLSIGLCLARVKSGGVFAPIAVHILFNTFNIALVL